MTGTRVFGCSIKWKDKIPDNVRWMEKVAREPVQLEKIDPVGMKVLRANADSGKLRLVNFWATWCGPCKVEIPWLISLQEKYKDDLVVLGFSVDDTVEKMKPYATDFGINYPGFFAGDAEKDAYLESFAAKCRELFAWWKNTVVLLPVQLVFLAMLRKFPATKFAA